jgi:hypothetical protein
MIMTKRLERVIHWAIAILCAAVLGAIGFFWAEYRDVVALLNVILDDAGFRYDALGRMKPLSSDLGAFGYWLVWVVVNIVRLLVKLAADVLPLILITGMLRSAYKLRNLYPKVPHR